MAKIITSLQHPLVKHLVKLRDNRDYRSEQKTAMIEGRTLVQEVCSKHRAKTILVSNQESIPKEILTDEIFVVNEAVLKKITGMASCSNKEWIAEVYLPQPHPLLNMQWVVAFDGISDPGNLGALLRTALALGWQGAYLLENSCDPFNDKALRAAKGATFSLPMASGNWEKLKEIVKMNNLQPLIADTKGQELSTLAQQHRILLVLGNEAHGPSKESLQMGEQIYIPMPGSMESLNVSIAGGILMYVLKSR